MIKAIQIPYDRNFEWVMKSAAKAGFSDVAVYLNGEHERKDGGIERTAERILKILEQNGMRCVQTHLPNYDLGISSEILDETMEEAIQKAIAISAEIRARWCVCHPRSSVSTGYDSKAALADNRRSIDAYLELAEKLGIGIAVENIPEFPRAKIPYYTSQYEDLLELADSFQSERIGVCWDFGHANLMKWDHAEAIRRMGERIKCTHIHNNFGLQDNHLCPDQGTINWENVISALRSIQYCGPLTLESRLNRYVVAEWTESYLRHNYTCVTYLESALSQ